MKKLLFACAIGLCIGWTVCYVQYLKSSVNHLERLQVILAAISQPEDTKPNPDLARIDAELLKLTESHAESRTAMADLQATVSKRYEDLDSIRDHLNSATDRLDLALDNTAVEAAADLPAIVLDQARTALKAGNPAAAEALLVMSLDMQATRPISIPVVWPKLKELILSLDGSSSKRLDWLIEELESIDSAFSNCSSRKSYDEITEIRRSVAELAGQEIAIRRKEFLRRQERDREIIQSTDELSLVVEHVNGRSQEIAEELERFEFAVWLLHSTPIDLEMPGAVSLLAQAAEKADAEVTTVQQRFDELREKSKKSPVKPAKPDDEGAAQALIIALNSLVENAASLSTEGIGLDWNQTGAISGAMALRENVGRLQRTRYNLWALTKIFAAEDNVNWDVYLGRIDTVFLTPEVMTLYSMAYDDAIAKAKTASQKSGRVRTVLNVSKFDLKRF